MSRTARCQRGQGGVDIVFGLSRAYLHFVPHNAEEELVKEPVLGVAGSEHVDEGDQLGDLLP